MVADIGRKCSGMPGAQLHTPGEVQAHPAIDQRGSPSLAAACQRKRLAVEGSRDGELIGGAANAVEFSRLTSRSTWPAR